MGGATPGKFQMPRRRPVPVEWREEHHWLNVFSRYYSQTPTRKTYRAGGTCSCGKTFGLRADRHNMDRADVIDAWKDHVEDAYYAAVERGEA